MGATVAPTTVWPALEEAFGGYAVRMNTIPKHVASRTLAETRWNATLLGAGVVNAVRELKARPAERSAAAHWRPPSSRRG
jgi:hypothetical protein